MASLRFLRVILVFIIYVRIKRAQHCEKGVKIPHIDLAGSMWIQTYGFCFNVSNLNKIVPKSCCAGYYEEGDNCIPVCKSGCQNGECTSPDICKCNKGNVMVNGRCVLNCDPECVNGECTAAGKCKCWKGYRALTDSNVSENHHRCEPICDPQYSLVENGVCVAPNVLRCNKPFILTLSTDSKLACANDSQIHEPNFDSNAALRKFCIVASIITGVAIIVVVAVKVFKCVFRNKCQINIYGTSTSEMNNDAEYGVSSNSPITTTVMSSNHLSKTRKNPNSKDATM